MGHWWTGVARAAGGLWRAQERSSSEGEAPTPRQGSFPRPNAGVPPSVDSSSSDHDAANASTQVNPDAGSPLSTPLEANVVGVTKTEVMCALRADVPNGFRRAQELLIAARRCLKAAEKRGEAPQPAAFEPLRQGCHALAAALGEDGWMPAEDIARDEAAAIAAFLQRFELAFQNWQAEYALLRQFLPHL